MNSDGFRNAQAADKTLQVFMKCEICPDLFVNKDVLFNIPSGECLEHYFGENSKQWIPHSLVHTFGQLASHWNHSSTGIFYACMHNLSMATFLEISKIIGEISPVLKDNANIDEIISLGFTGDHYAVIHILLSEKRAIVYDGMVTSTMDVWKNVVKYVLWKFGVQGLDNMDELIDERTKQKTEGIKDQWTISRDQTISGIQLDTHSCGPIAMLVIACLFQTRQRKMDGGTSLSQLHPANVPSKNWRSTACTLFKKFIEFTWTNMYSVKALPTADQQHVMDIHMTTQIRNFLSTGQSVQKDKTLPTNDFVEKSSKVKSPAKTIKQAPKELKTVPQGTVPQGTSTNQGNTTGNKTEQTKPELRRSRRNRTNR